MSRMSSKKLLEMLKSRGANNDTNACRGYCIYAMREAGFSEEAMWRVLNGLDVAFEHISDTEAAFLFNLYCIGVV